MKILLNFKQYFHHRGNDMKLVRDKIPKIMKEKGIEARFRKANDKEYRRHLYKKLNEEVKEFQLAKNKEELADILEVIEAICSLNGWKKGEIKKIKDEKSFKRGNFDKRIIMSKIKNIK